MRLAPSVLGLLLLAAAPAIAGEPRFEPRSSEIGHRYLGGWEHFVGGGVATLDCDNDLLPELFIASGSEPSVLLRNRTGKRGGTLSFEEDTPLPSG